MAVPLSARVSRDSDDYAGILSALQVRWWTVKALAEHFGIPKGRAIFQIRQIAVTRIVFCKRQPRNKHERMYRVFPQAFQVKAALRRVNR